MKAFFKSFFASFLALVVFAILGIFLLIGFIASVTTSDKPFVGSKAVLVLDLSGKFNEQSHDNPFSALIKETDKETPSLYDLVRMIHHAKSDSSVKGIYILCGNNANGFAASEEIRKALLDFKLSKKFIIAYGEAVSQKGYYVGNTADKLYCHPQGGVDWGGFSSNLMFLKGMLDKLEIQPQIFYAGKFKSATEPLRETQMTDANRLQTSVWLGDLYNRFLEAAAVTRSLDTAKLRNLAIAGTIQTANDAWANGLVDGLKYDDEVKKELLGRLHLGERERINFVSFGDYSKAVVYKGGFGEDKIAIIYADGDIVSGHGDNEPFLLQASNNLRFALGQDSGLDIRDADFAGDCLGGRGVVARQHDYVHARTAEFPNGGACIRFDRIGHANDAGKLPGGGDKKYRLAGLAELVGRGSCRFRNSYR